MSTTFNPSRLESVGVLDGSSAHPASEANLVAESVSAWFGANQALSRVSLEMPARTVTALIGPSGCGKSTFIRTLNRTHELVYRSAMAGRVLLDGQDIYAARTDPVSVRRDRKSVV